MPRFAPLLLAFALAFLPSANGFAQSYPTRPIKLVVGEVGGHSDIIGRTLAQKLADILQQPVVIDNRGGVGGTIGAEIVARAPGDGYTLLLGGSNNLVIATTLVKEMRYDPVRDFVPIGGVATVPYALAVSPSLPVTNVAELVAYARAHPGRLNYGSSGTGSTSNLAAELLKSAADVDIVHVPYRGSAPAVMALVSGQIDMMFADLSPLVPHAKAGTLRLLAAAGARRAPVMPELSTVVEQGIPGIAIEPWYGIVASAGTPPEVVATLSSALGLAMKAPEVRQLYRQRSYEPFAINPAQLGALIVSDIKEYATLIKRAGIKADP